MVSPWAKPPAPPLRLTPYAWAKLLYWRDAGDTEIGGFGISTSADPLLIEDVVLVRQRCDWASVVFDDASVADLFDRQVDEGRRPEEFARVWVHTHPGATPQPSVTDEETFSRVFGGCDWAVMVIAARNGATYARLRFGVGPGGSVDIPVEVDFTAPFPAAERGAWRAEYDACVEALPDPWLGPEAEPFDWDSADMLPG
jgi:proteasome lid subunit RPN8/RPN11